MADTKQQPGPQGATRQEAAQATAQPEPGAAGAAPPSSPPHNYVSEFDLGVTMAYANLLFGRPRGLVGSDGQPLGSIGIEWFAGITMSPVTLKQLAEGLTRAVEAYEKQFGTIVLSNEGQGRE